jgi:hypothetical protein
LTVDSVSRKVTVLIVGDAKTQGAAMAARPPDPDSIDEPALYAGTPRWVKAFAIIAVLVVVLIAFILASGLGGPHGPQRHGAGSPGPVGLATQGILGR